MATTTRSRRSSSGTSRRKTSSRSKAGSGRRERIAPRGDTRYVRRDSKGRFDEVDDAGRSNRQDRRTKSKRKSKSGYGDRGDR